jgi:hypothetical protein
MRTLLLLLLCMSAALNSAATPAAQCPLGSRGMIVPAEHVTFWKASMGEAEGTGITLSSHRE